MRDCLWRYAVPVIAVGAFGVAAMLLSPLLVYHVFWGSDVEGIDP